MASTVDQFSNFATSTVAGGAGGVGTSLLSTDTTLHLATGDGANFPATTNGPFSLLFGTITGTHEICQCTARSGDTLTLVRGGTTAEGTTAQTWAFGSAVAQMVTAANLAHLWTRLQGVCISVKDYGAVGDGTTDDTAAIQAAITAVQNAGGGKVLLPGPSAISTTLTITADNVELIGSGRNSQLIAKSGFPAAPMIWVEAPGGAGNFRHGIVIRDLLLVNTVTATAIGIELDSTYYATIERVDIEGVYAENIYLNGTSGAVGAYTRIRDCHLGAVSGGATSGGFGVLTSNHEFNVIEACVFNWFSLATGRAIKLQNDNNVVMGCTFDECDTSVDIAFQPRNCIIGNQFDRGLTRYLYLEGATQSYIAGNIFGGQAGGAAGTRMIEVSGSGNGGNVIIGNIAQSGTTWAQFVFENGGIGSTPPNLYLSNQTQGLPIVLTTGIARGNSGFNPQGAGLNAPATPTVSGTGTGGTLTVGTYQAKITYVNSAGETTASVQGSATLTSGQNLQITSPGASGNATGWYAYVTQAGGSTYTRQQAAGSPTAIGTNLTLTTNPTTTGLGTPATNSSGVIAPSVPASTVAQTNTSGVDCTVYVTGGTVTVIAVGGMTTGLTSGAFRVPAGGSITLTYSAAPTWKWFGD